MEVVLAKKDKFRSPYDPKYVGKGKIEKPKDKKEEEQHALRGCGDPMCPMCNPETASVGGSRPRTGSTFTINNKGFTVGRDGGLEAAIRDARMQVLSQIFSSNGLFGMDSGSSRENQPPASYISARKSVEDWLIKAPDQSFDDIVGNDDALSQLRDAIKAPVDHKELFEAYGMAMPKGALLSGPPGCGKTMFARAAASEMRKLYGSSVEFISISGSELQSPYVGVTEGHIKAIFAFAREYKAYHGHPLLVFMDEAEVLLPDRTGRVRRVAPWEESQVATFLAEMDGIQESGAFVLLATNRPEVIDQAVLRDGRCDFKIVVKRPTIDAIEIILRKNFDGALIKGNDLDAMVFAAVEAFLDPHKIIVEAHAIEIGDSKLIDRGGKNFLLEHILSGAMAASVPARAKRYAFSRDKAGGKALGITTDDVVRSISDIFEENRGLEHSFALDEFKREFEKEILASEKRKLN